MYEQGFYGTNKNSYQVFFKVLKKPSYCNSTSTTTAPGTTLYIFLLMLVLDRVCSCPRSYVILLRVEGLRYAVTAIPARRVYLLPRILAIDVFSCTNVLSYILTAGRSDRIDVVN